MDEGDLEDIPDGNQDRLDANLYMKTHTCRICGLSYDRPTRAVICCPNEKKLERWNWDDDDEEPEPLTTHAILQHRFELLMDES